MPRVSARAEFNDHHIVPKQLYENPKTASQSRVADFLESAGYFRDALNESTVRLPTGRSGFEKSDSSSIHRGSHPEYTKQVERTLLKVEKYSDANNLSQQQTCEAVTSVIDTYQSSLESGSMSLNNAVDYRDLAPSPAPYCAPRETYQAPEPAPAPTFYRAPSPPREIYRAPSPVTYQESYRAPSPVIYRAPSPVIYREPYRAPSPPARSRWQDDSYVTSSSSSSSSSSCSSSSSSSSCSYEPTPTPYVSIYVEANFDEHGGVDCAKEDIKGVPDQDNYQLLIPVDKSLKEKIRRYELRKILHEVNMTLNVTDLLPFISLEQEKNLEIGVVSTMHDTLVGRSMLEADYFMKSFVHNATYFLSKDAEKGLNVYRKFEKGANPHKVSEAFVSAGAINLKRDIVCGDKFKEFSKLMTDEPFKMFTDKPVERQGLLIRAETNGAQTDKAGNVIFDPKLNFISHANCFLSDETAKKFDPENKLDLSKRQNVKFDQDEAEYLAFLKDNFSCLRTDMPYHLKMIEATNCITSFVQTLRGHNRIPVFDEHYFLQIKTARFLPPIVANLDDAHMPNVLGGVSHKVNKITASEIPEKITKKLSNERSCVEIDGKHYVSILVKTEKIQKETNSPAWLWHMRKRYMEKKAQSSSIESKSTPKPYPNPSTNLSPKPVSKPKKKGLFACCGRPD